MTPDEQIVLLREAFLKTQAPWSTRVIAIVLSLTLAAVVVALVRRRALREEYTPLWLIVAGGACGICLWPGLLQRLTILVGAWSPSSTIFFFGQIVLVAICLSYAVRLSGMTLQIKNLSQELALLRAEVDEVRARDS